MKKLFALAVLIALAPAAALASPITSLRVFGDSLSDQANAFFLTGGTFPPAPYVQRASNGPVAVEVLAGALGVPLSPATTGGTNYAVVGATTGPVLIPSTSVTTDNFAAVQYNLPALANTGVTNQVLSYLLSGPVVDPESSLFVVWSGPNDFFIDPSARTAANAVANLALAIQLLYVNGARQFFVPNMPDLSLTPFGLGLPSPASAGLQALSLGFNIGLSAALAQLQALPGVAITPFDTFAFLTAISTDPAAFGFANATAPCISGNLGTGGTVCADPSTYVFWDSVHPTAAAHQVLGEAFARSVASTAVPEPTIFLLLGTGLAAVMARRRFKSPTHSRHPDVDNIPLVSNPASRP